MTYIDVAKKVAEIIIQDCREDGFESFKYMCEVNWWETEDIKEYIDGILEDEFKDRAYLDEIDGDIIIEDDEIISFRKFMIAVRKELKLKGY